MDACCRCLLPTHEILLARQVHNGESGQESIGQKEADALKEEIKSCM